MKISLIQMRVTGDKARDIAHAEELALSARGSDIIVLPEMFCCPYDTAAFPLYAEPDGGETTKALSRMAAGTGAYLVGGSFPEYEDGRIYNTSPVFAPDGSRIAKHRKAHLFDIDVRGGQRFFESDTLSAGGGPTVFNTPFGDIGVCVCFDIRFPDLAAKMRGISALIVPATFNMTTGPLHWELLFRARAVDGQMFAFGCAPARDASAGYVSYANSIAVDPWGRVIARAGEDETVLTVSADMEEPRRVRRQIPIGVPDPV